MVLKQVMRLYLENQWKTLTRIAGGKREGLRGKGKDELQMLLDGYDSLMGSVLAMVENVGCL